MPFRGILCDGKYNILKLLLFTFGSTELLFSSSAAAKQAVTSWIPGNAVRENDITDSNHTFHSPLNIESIKFPTVVGATCYGLSIQILSQNDAFASCNDFATLCYVLILRERSSNISPRFWPIKSHQKSRRSPMRNKARHWGMKNVKSPWLRHRNSIFSQNVQGDRHVSEDGVVFMAWYQSVFDCKIRGKTFEYSLTILHIKMHIDKLGNKMSWLCERVEYNW